MILLFSCLPQTIEMDTAPDPSQEPSTYYGWEYELSLIYEGTVLHNLDTISKITAPAGINNPIELSFVISNLQDTEISFSGDWLEFENDIAWNEHPPSSIPAQSSISFSLGFNPESCTTEMVVSNTIRIPQQDLSISIEMNCPPPLRIIVLGDDGYTLLSDDYGFSYRALPIQENPPLRAQSLTWGNGIFLRAFSRGSSADGMGFYQYSLDGENWLNSEGDLDYAPSDCAYGLGRFVCLRADSLSWSIDGRSITHEPALGEFRLNQILFRTDAFVAVGRGARRVRSEDAHTWNLETFGTDPDTYHSLVQSKDIIVAGGGINRYFLSYSSDDGKTWQDSPYGGCQGNYIQSLAYHNNLFLAQGASSCHHNMHRSTDGINWEPIVELTPFARFVLLGAINGYFIAHSTDEDGTHLYRSTNGFEWDKRYTIEPAHNVRLMTHEEWSP